MPGQWPQSFSTIQDLNGKPIVRAKAYFYIAGTLTPMETYQDYGLTTPHTNPLETDGFGRFPAVFLDEVYGFYRVRVTTPGGSILYDSDTLPIIGPAGGGGGSPPDPVDPDAVARTGDLKARYGNGFHAGWVRCNGRTIGTATSGASERAAADTQALYEYLWAADPNLEVVGGRGGSANADWSANKPLTLPDWRGRVIVGNDIMGNIAAGVLTDADELGAKGGSQTHTLVIGEMPAHNHTITINSSGNHTHPVTGSNEDTGDNGNLFVMQNSGSVGTKFTGADGAHTHTATIANRGGGGPHNNTQPYNTATIYIRL